MVSSSKVSGEKGVCIAQSLDTDKVALLDECDLIGTYLDGYSRVFQLESMTFEQ